VLYKLACVGAAPAHTTVVSSHRASAMKMPSWLKKTKNDHEASSSRGTRRSRMPLSSPPSTACPPPALLRQLPHAPRPEDYVGRGACVEMPPPRQCERLYVPLEECEQLWAANQSVDHNGVSLLQGCTSTVSGCQFRRRGRWAEAGCGDMSPPHPKSPRVAVA
jgi:hypothetical protein